MVESPVRLSTSVTYAQLRPSTPLSASSLSGDKVYQDLFDLTDESEMGHIALSRSADLVVVAWDPKKLKGKRNISIIPKQISRK